MSALECQLHALMQERRGYAARVEELARSRNNPQELDADMALITCVNQSIIDLARRSGRTVA